MKKQDETNKMDLNLHIGCGSIAIPGYVNIDIRYLPNVDVVDNAEFLRKFKNENVSIIYACHVLEHFNRWRISSVLKRWFDLLMCGGILYLAVPDFESIVSYYNKTKDIKSLIGLLHGGQDYKENFHCMSWDFKSLQDCLLFAGFDSVNLYEWEDVFGSFDDYSKCYLPHMDKENGMLMSLNVKAVKK